VKNSDTFQLHIQGDLSSGDFKVLALLYQPLLGLDAHALYTTFYQLLNRTVVERLTHQLLFDLLNLKQNEFLKLRNKLEALNLLEAYEKEEYYIYLLKSPLTAKQFLTDTVFGSYLQSEIGEKNFQQITHFFKVEVPSCEGYKNITKTFDQMYEVKQLNLLTIDHPLQGRQQNKGSLINHTFDYEKFVGLVPERSKSIQLLSERFKEQITKISFVYQFNPAEMAEVYEQAAKDKQNVQFSQLNLKARLYYQKNNKSLAIQEKNLSESHVLDAVTPAAIVSKYGVPSHAGIALATASALLERNDVSPGIINAMVMFTLKHKEGILPNLSYMEKVLNSWLESGIRTTEDALSYSRKLESKWEKQSKKQKQKENEPDWMDRYVETLTKME